MIYVGYFQIEHKTFLVGVAVPPFLPTTLYKDITIRAAKRRAAGNIKQVV